MSAKADGREDGHAMTTPEARGLRLGVLWAAWWLHSGYGEDSLAVRLLRESIGRRTAQRLARQEDYTFKRGFWSDSEWGTR